MGGKFLYAIVLSILILPLSTAFSADSDQFNLTKGVFSSGGQVYDNPQFSGDISVGLLTGESTSTQYTLGLGIFFSENITVEEPPLITPTGGGGVRVKKIYTLTNLEKVFDLKVNDEVKFTHNTELHTITLIEIGDNYVIVEISSDTIKIIIDMGKTEIVDVDQDGIDDLELTLLSILYGKAKIKIKRIVTVPPVAQPTPIRCGDGVVSPGETSENCCIDAGCTFNFRCENNVCIEIPPGICGDGICELEEVCPEDCLIEEARFVAPRPHIIMLSVALAFILLFYRAFTVIPKRFKPHYKEAERYVKTHKVEGGKRMKYTLMSLGWEDKKVDRFLKKAGLRPTKVKGRKPEYESIWYYIARSHKTGKSLWKIKRELIKAGWDKDLIITLINKYKQYIRGQRAK